MSSTTGSNKVPDLSVQPHLTEVGTEFETYAGRRTARLRAAIRTAIGERAANIVLGAERADGYQLGRSSKTRQDREIEHSAAHMDIPEAFITALQHGPYASTPATFPVGDVILHMTVTAEGTGIPEPHSRAVWEELTRVLEDTTGQPYCADVITPLPREIAALVWTGDEGTVTVTPARSRPTRLRSLVGLVLLPLTRAGDILTVSTVSASAAAVFAGGALTPTTVPGQAEPLPDLQPKVSTSASASGERHPGRKLPAPAAARPRPRAKVTASPRVPQAFAVPSPRPRSGAGHQASAKRPSPAVNGAKFEVRTTTPAAVPSTPAGPADDCGHSHRRDKQTPSGRPRIRQSLGPVGAALGKDR